MSLRDYLHALDRQKSIDNCFLTTPSSAERLYLFDEIKKLTNHLFKTTIQAEPHMNGDAIKHAIQTSTDRVHDMNTQNLNTTQTTSVESATKSNTFEESDDVGVNDGSMARDDMADVNNNINSKINDAQESAENSLRSHPFSEIFKKFASLADAAASQANDPSPNAPWPVSTKRTKFRINQMSSRDVPIVRTEKPAKLTKQNAIDACDTKLFDEQISHNSIFQHPQPTRVSDYGIVDLLNSFEHDRNQLFQSHFRHKTFVDRLQNGSISFDCGQLGVEQRSMNTIRSLFQLHATTGRHVKQIQERIEAKYKWNPACHAKKRLQFHLALVMSDKSNKHVRSFCDKNMTRRVESPAIILEIETN